MSKRHAIGAILVAALASLLVAPPAAAYEAEVDASVDAQFYTLRSPFGDPVVRRRRFTQTLGLAVYDIQGGDFVLYGPQLAFRARLRLDGDFGKEGAELDPRRADRYSPGIDQAPLDLMYAYLEGKNYAGGWLGFRLGRQYVVDALGFWSFDGGLVRVTTPVFLQFEAYGGFEQRGGLPMLATPRWEADGVYRGNRDGLEQNQWPSYLEESALAPAWGFAIETSGVHWVHGRLTYRRVTNRDTVYISPFADAGGGFNTVGPNNLKPASSSLIGDRISTEKLGYALRAGTPSLGDVSGSIVYDFYNQTLSEYTAAADFYAIETITLGADYEYYLPTFDGDSIWNWFAHEGMTTLEGRATFAPWRQLDFAATGGVRTYRTIGDSGAYLTTGDTSQTGELNDLLGSLAARYRWSDGSIGLRSLGETGRRGHRVGGDVTTTKTFDEGFYDTLFIVSLYDWEDRLRPTRDALSFSYVVGGGVSPFQRTRMGVEWEHSMNRLVGQRYRVLATLNFTILQ